MVNILSPFRPSPLGRGWMREIKTAFIPYGTNAARYRVRGATQLRLVLNKKSRCDATGASLTLFKHDHLVYALAR
jgi:hypothetical protein